MKYLLDTCTISELVKISPNVHVRGWFGARKAHELFISAVSWAELHRGVRRLEPSKRQSDLTRWLNDLEIGFEERILAFDRHVAQTWSEMTVQAETQGKPMAAFDSMIAATARTHGCKLVTRNVRDFAHAGVDLINPWLETDQSVTPMINPRSTPAKTRTSRGN